MTRRYARAEIGERACGFAPVNWKRLTVLGAFWPSISLVLNVVDAANRRVLKGARL
jgi:hypothetical protein